MAEYWFAKGKDWHHALRMRSFSASFHAGPPGVARCSQIILAVLLCALPQVVWAQEPTPQTPLRVFPCGHSFLAFSMRPLPALARSANLPYAGAGEQFLPNATLATNWEVPDADNKAKATLRTGQVDVLVVSPHYLIPDPGLDDFTKFALEKNPNLRVLAEVCWPAMDGVFDRRFRKTERDAATVEMLQLGQALFQKKWAEPFHEQVRALNESLGHRVVSVVPVADAVFALRKLVAQGKAPGIKNQSGLFSDSLGHPERIVANLAAYCIFAVLYERSPVGMPVPLELQDQPEIEALNPLLQQLAWDAVTSCPLSGVKTADRP